MLNAASALAVEQDPPRRIQSCGPRRDPGRDPGHRPSRKRRELLRGTEKQLHRHEGQDSQVQRPEVCREKRKG